MQLITSSKQKPQQVYPLLITDLIDIKVRTYGSIYTPYPIAQLDLQYSKKNNYPKLQKSFKAFYTGMLCIVVLKAILFQISVLIASDLLIGIVSNYYFEPKYQQRTYAILQYTKP